MHKYKTTSFSGITSVEIERETDSSVYINGRRRSKRSEYEDYFDTWEEAHEFLTRRAQDDVESARHVLERANSRLGNIKGMKKPT